MQLWTRPESKSHYFRLEDTYFQVNLQELGESREEGELDLFLNDVVGDFAI